MVSNPSNALRGLTAGGTAPSDPRRPSADSTIPKRSLLVLSAEMHRTTFPLKLTLGIFCILGAAISAAAQTQTQPCIVVTAASSRFRSSLPQLSWPGRKSARPSEPVVPVSADQNICPLTNGQKFHMFLRDAYSPLTIVSAGLTAAISQASQGRGSHGYGQGWDAYGARFGAALAHTEVSGLFQTAVFPSLLHEDPRYFPARTGTFGHRFGFAISRVVVARKDRGGHRFNFSEIVGAMLAGAASNAWVTDSDRTVSRTFSYIGIGLASDAGWNVVKEFVPDIWRHFSRHKQQQPAAGSTSGD